MRIVAVRTFGARVADLINEGAVHFEFQYLRIVPEARRPGVLTVKVARLSVSGDVNKIILDTLALMEHQFKTSQIRVEDELSSHLPTIQGNAGRLQQVFLNLFLNAKDAMSNGGTLKISTMNGDAVSVVVSDTGTGIAQEHIQRIYDPFFTTKAAPQEGQRKGTGLGLSVTYGIIQEHAGKIRVESKPGEGTSFYLDFPLTRKTVNV